MRNSHRWFCSIVLFIAAALSVRAQQVQRDGRQESIFSPENIHRATAQTSGTAISRLSPGDAAWSRVLALPTNGQVRVLRDDGTESQGLLRSADNYSIVLVVADREEAVLRAKVARVLVAHGTTRKRHTWIGVIVGGLGGVIGVGIACGGDNGCMEKMPVYFWGGVATGALIGHGVPAGPVWQEVYAR